MPLLRSARSSTIRTEVLPSCSSRAALIIAHRLSTIRHSDLILVLRDGHVSRNLGNAPRNGRIRHSTAEIAADLTAIQPISPLFGAISRLFRVFHRYSATLTAHAGDTRLAAPTTGFIDSIGYIMGDSSPE
ncbi:MAG TPA: hypothetical protein VK899_00455 [Gemmatimonadales bacterium]|nr:hypothetical protein [Gemmatimonadales bacterium]